MWESPPFDVLVSALEDPSHPIGMRMRAAYYLRHEYITAQQEPQPQDLQDQQQQQQVEQPCYPAERRRKDVVQALARGLRQSRHGALMRHEFAYVMGQLRDEEACDCLEAVLQDPQDDVMVRHEAAEALGAIGASRSTAVLQTVLESTKDIPELSQTCRLALNVMEWRQAGSDVDNVPDLACACMLNPYSTVDPAPPHPAHANTNLVELGDILCNVETPMFERYRAMFSLRNRGGETAVRQLCRALVTDTSSALLRHEVAYVLGQMQHPASVEALEQSLRRTDEHAMVRHESAEALGAIEGRWADVERILKEFSNDDNVVVRESCLVALDAADYWSRSTTDCEGGDTQETFAHVKADPSLVVVNHFNVHE